MSWLTRAARLACAGALIAATARAQDLPITRWLVRGPIPTDTGATRLTRDYLGGETTVLPDSGDVIAGGVFVPVDADSLGRRGPAQGLHRGDGPRRRVRARLRVRARGPDRPAGDGQRRRSGGVAERSARVAQRRRPRAARRAATRCPCVSPRAGTACCSRPSTAAAASACSGASRARPVSRPLDGDPDRVSAAGGLAAHLYPASPITASALRLVGAADPGTAITSRFRPPSRSPSGAATVCRG